MTTPKKIGTTKVMLDTVSLKIKHPDFKVTRPELFSPKLIMHNPQSDFIRKEINGFQKYTQNASAEDREKGQHRPCLTVYRRFEDMLTYDLHAEFSIPKMLFGNNLQELRDEDFPSVVSKLRSELAGMGVEVSEDVIRNSIVTKAHFGKNVVLPENLTVKDAIVVLQKADLGRAMEVNRREFKNGGDALYFYTTSRNIVFYDKVKDIDKDRNVAVDKNKTAQEKELLGTVLSPQTQILRLEIRFTRQISVTSFVGKLLNEKLESVTFAKIFNGDLCRNAVLASWNDIADRPSNQLAFKMTISPEEVLNAIISREQTNKSAHALNRVLVSFGLYNLIKEFGIRYVRDKLEAVWSNESCGKRLNKKIIQSAVSLQEIPNIAIISWIGSKLKEFERYDLPPTIH